MYRISELATKVSMSRTALLYYEKLGLIEVRLADNVFTVKMMFSVLSLSSSSIKAVSL